MRRPAALGSIPGVWFLKITMVITLSFLLIPVFIVLVMSIGEGDRLTFPPSGVTTYWYETLFAQARWSGAIATSVVLGLSVGLSSSVAGLCAAYIYRYLSGLKAAGWDYLMAVPLIIPPVVLGTGQRLTFGTASGSMWTVGLCHAALALPVSYWILRDILTTTVIPLEDAARVFGASRLHAFRKVSLRLARRSLVAAALLGFVVSFDEAVMVLFLEIDTLPRLMFEGLRYDISPLVAAAAGLIVIIEIVVVAISELTRALSARQAARTGREPYDRRYNLWQRR